MIGHYFSILNPQVAPSALPGSKQLMKEAKHESELATLFTIIQAALEQRHKLTYIDMLLGSFSYDYSFREFDIWYTISILREIGYSGGIF